MIWNRLRKADLEMEYGQGDPPAPDPDYFGPFEYTTGQDLSAPEGIPFGRDLYAHTVMGHAQRVFVVESFDDSNFSPEFTTEYGGTV